MSLLKVNNVTDLGDDAVITDGALVGAGKILQVIQTVKSDEFSTSSTSFADLTGLSVTITPSSTASKILVMGDVKYANDSRFATADASAMKVRRDAVDIYLADSAGSRTRANFMSRLGVAESDVWAFIFLDSPSSTSAITYSVQGLTTNAARPLYINRGTVDTDSSNYARGASSITVMEVAG